jgi:3-polyprenyl-4-hydroxybenzoate decarboxylase
MKSCIVAITGASGSIYGLRLVEELLNSVENIHLCLSKQSFFVIKTETGIERSADVAIKEGRMLIVSPREMPFNAIHLENMLKLARLGVTIAPPLPAFYQKPESIDEIVDFVVGKILDCAGISHLLFRRWK